MKNSSEKFYKKYGGIIAIIIWVIVFACYGQITGTNLKTFYLDYIFKGDLIDKYLCYGSNLLDSAKSIMLWGAYLFAAAFVARIFTDRESILGNIIFDIPFLVLAFPLVHACAVRIYVSMPSFDKSSLNADTIVPFLLEVFVLLIISWGTYTLATTKTNQLKALMVVAVCAASLLVFQTSSVNAWLPLGAACVAIAAAFDVSREGAGYKVCNAIMTGMFKN